MLVLEGQKPVFSSLNFIKQLCAFKMPKSGICVAKISGIENGKNIILKAKKWC